MVWRCALALVVGTGCFAKPDPPGAGRDGSVDSSVTGGWLPSYAFRRRITIHRGTSPDDTLVDFPVSVVLDDDDGLRNDARLNDRVFTASDGATVLAYEVVSFDATNGSLDAWVRVPSLPIGDTVLYLYYGGPVASQQSSLTWSSTSGAWHMGGVANESDSSDHVAELSPGDPTTRPTLVSGVAGSARLYDGINDHLCAPAGNDVVPLGSVDSVSFSLWVNVNNSALFDSPLNRGGNNANTPGFTFELGTDTWDAEFSDGTQHVYVGLTPVRTNVWTQLAAVLDRSGGKVLAYVDGMGMPSADAPSFGSLDPAGNFCLGSPMYPLDGRLDEVRMYRDAKPQAWFVVEHTNLTNRSQFMTIGAQEMQ